MVQASTPARAAGSGRPGTDHSDRSQLSMAGAVGWGHLRTEGGVAGIGRGPILQGALEMSGTGTDQNRRGGGRAANIPGIIGNMAGHLERSRSPGRVLVLPGSQVLASSKK